MANKVSEIKIHIGLDSESVPQSIHWGSTDNPDGSEMRECKAMLLSLFDKDHLDTYKVDLWTKELQVVEMDRFMFQTLRALADTYFNATRNQELANDFRKFIEYFGQQTEIIPPDDPA